MRRLAFTALVVLLAAAVAAPVLAAPHPRVTHKAVEACRAERAELGGEAFKEKYANENGKRAFRRCVRATVDEIAPGLRAAVKACRAERAELGGEAFKEKYANEDGKAPFRACAQANLPGSGEDAAS